MAEKSLFWTTGGAGDGASTYTRADFALAFKLAAACRAFQGVAPNYLNELVGSAPAVNTARIGTGGAIVDGKPYENSAPVDVNVPSAVGGGNTRIDRIVLRADWTAQTVRITRIAGTDAISPTAPAITQTSETTYDIMLYQVLVTVGGALTLTDERVMADIADGEIVNAMMAADSVDTIQIKALAVTPPKLATGSTYGVQATSGVSQAAAVGASVYIDLEEENFDDDAMHDLVTDNSRLTCKRDGRYFIFGRAQVSGASGPSEVILSALKNRASFVAEGKSTWSMTATTGTFWTPFSDYVDLVVGDYLEMRLTQYSGATKNILGAQFSMVLDS